MTRGRWRSGITAVASPSCPKTHTSKAEARPAKRPGDVPEPRPPASPHRHAAAVG
jgi:hypothetical protein